jgi:hypothetical protein
MNYLSYASNPWFWVLFVWSFAWKGVALWKAGERQERGWFIALYIVNVAGLLEIYYLFFIANRTEDGDVDSLPAHEK